MKLGLDNQNVLITGSGSGIGRGIAEGFLKEKASVILSDFNEKCLSNATRDLSSLYGKDKIMQLLGDLNKSEILESLYQYIINEAKGLNHLVCNIGSGVSVPPLHEEN